MIWCVVVNESELLWGDFTFINSHRVVHTGVIVGVRFSSDVPFHFRAIEAVRQSNRMSKESRSLMQKAGAAHGTELEGFAH